MSLIIYRINRELEIIEGIIDKFRTLVFVDIFPRNLRETAKSTAIRIAFGAHRIYIYPRETRLPECQGVGADGRLYLDNYLTVLPRSQV